MIPEHHPTSGNIQTTYTDELTEHSEMIRNKRVQNMKEDFGIQSKKENNYIEVKTGGRRK